MKQPVQAFDNAYWKSHNQRRVYRHQAALGLLKPGDGPVMDVGCGDGLFLGIMEENGIDAWGCDHAEVAVDACRRKGLQAESCDFAAGEIPPCTARTAVALDVLEHLYEPERLLNALHSKVETIVVSVPNFGSLPARLQVLCGNVPENNQPSKGHVYWFTHSVLLGMLKRTGWAPEIIMCNVQLERLPVIGDVMAACARLFPSLFGLSFVVRAKRERLKMS